MADYPAVFVYETSPVFPTQKVVRYEQIWEMHLADYIVTNSNSIPSNTITHKYIDYSCAHMYEAIRAYNDWMPSSYPYYSLGVGCVLGAELYQGKHTVYFAFRRGSFECGDFCYYNETTSITAEASDKNALREAVILDSYVEDSISRAFRYLDIVDISSISGIPAENDLKILYDNVLNMTFLVSGIGNNHVVVLDYHEGNNSIKHGIATWKKLEWMLKMFTDRLRKKIPKWKVERRTFEDGDGSDSTTWKEMTTSFKTTDGIHTLRDLVEPFQPKYTIPMDNIPALFRINGQYVRKDDKLQLTNDEAEALMKFDIAIEDRDLSFVVNYFRVIHRVLLYGFQGKLNSNQLV